MSKTNQRIAAAVGVALLVIYSWIMMDTSGTAASWAWLILVGGLALLAVAARTAVAERSRK